MISLDHYIGREVVGVEDDANAEGESDWVIRLVGDVLIHNADRRRTARPEIEGLSFFGVSYDSENTTLRFGHYDQTRTPVVDQEVVLTATAYALTDPNVEGGPHFPQRVTPEEESLLPRDPSPERVADGPQQLSEGTPSHANTDGDPED